MARARCALIAGRHRPWGRKQAPAERSHPVTAASDGQVASDEIAHLFREHRRDLERAVTAAVRAPRDLVEHAWQNAWTIMVRSQPRRATWFAWLRIVAIHQAWEQCAGIRNERPGGLLTSPYVNEIGAYEDPEPPADAPDVPDQVADRIQHAQRLTDLAAIKPQDRRTLYRRALAIATQRAWRSPAPATPPLSRGVHVNVAVRMGPDVDDMSPTDAVVGLRRRQRG